MASGVATATMLSIEYCPDQSLLKHLVTHRHRQLSLKALCLSAADVMVNRLTIPLTRAMLQPEQLQHQEVEVSD
ncbi:hypothetical protein HN018_00555 [Lichenicola cladoniae]|uniref:Uncharacterized protein n=1 Tax=Lichenicola cladoniae TaxID=1484109 RepID=A0A6M8HGC6_9PROT|nr:hypothetical protein [Lichenicola cladoniae]NPD65136.1 hypothetical protein [Acetobacteraceae bacterium]QKE88742.1 hypothetical protein HN018_00555 [Lichenicola cladoniae]